MQNNTEKGSSPKDMQILCKNLFVMGQMFISLGLLQAVGYFTSFGLITMIYGDGVLASNSKELPVGAIVILISSALTYLLASFPLALIPIIHKFKAYRIMRSDGFEKYEIRLCRWYARILTEFADGVKKKNSIQE